VCVGCTISCPNCVSNAIESNVFVGSGDIETKYKLQTVTPNPALNTGVYGNGDDIGAYNDGVGRPTSISSFQFLSINASTLNATISTKGNN
jgi:hypothetical protein